MLNLKTLAGSAAAAALLLAAGAGHADTKVVNLTLDLNAQPIDQGYIIGGPGFVSPAFSVDLAVGDTLDLTIDFLGNQQITAQGISATFPSIWTDADYSNGSNIHQTGVLSFLAADGSAAYTTPVVSKDDGSVHAGQFVNSGELGAIPDTLTFSGAHWVGTIDAYDGVRTTRNYTLPVYYLDARTVSISESAGGVPEPASWALMMIGFGGLGAAMRRRRSLGAAVA